MKSGGNQPVAVFYRMAGRQDPATGWEGGSLGRTGGLLETRGPGRVLVGHPRPEWKIKKVSGCVF